MENKLRRSFKFIRTRPCVPTVHNISFKKKKKMEKNENMPTTQYWFLGESESEGTKS